VAKVILENINSKITRKTVNDEYHSDAKTEEWKQTEDAGLLSMATRSGVLTDVERKARRNKSSRDWQLAATVRLGLGYVV
jgi:hypothetical protein